MKKIWKTLTSMQAAIALLILLAAACAVASLVTQGQSYEWYARQYSERTAALILALRLDDAFHSWWFILLNAFLCLNLIFCNLIRLPQLVRRTREADSVPAQWDAEAVCAGDPRPVFRKLGMPEPREEPGGESRTLFSSKNRAGLWGAWVCHLGILLLIIGFSLGQATKEEYVVYGVAGDTRQVGDTGYFLTIDDFKVLLREDDTVEQYLADITVRDLEGGRPAESAEVSVNHPAKLFGMTFYQNSTGWAARVTVSKNGEELDSKVICAGDGLPVKDMPELVVYLTAFYPDYVMVPGSGPMTATGELRNPAYLYSVYYQGSILGMNILMPEEVLTIDDYTVTFSDPQSYTLIQAKRDRFTPVALAGGLVTLLGLVLAFYLPPRRVWATENGEGTWTIYGASRKGGVIFREEFLTAVKGENHAES